MANVTLLSIANLYTEMFTEDEVFGTLSLADAQSAVTIEFENKFGTLTDDEREKIDASVADLHTAQF